MLLNMTREEYTRRWRETGRQKLRFIVKRHFPTVVEAAKVIGIHRVQLFRYMSGRVAPVEGTLERICHKLGNYSPEYFFKK